MKKSRYTDSQIIAILKQNESEISIADRCREPAMSQTSFYQWRSKYGGMDASMMKELKQLNTENARLKRMYGEEELKAEIAPRGHRKKVVTPSRRKQMATLKPNARIQM